MILFAYVRDSGNGKRERVVVDMADINIIRIESKLESMFEGKIDTSDLDGKKTADEIKKVFLSRSLAAIAIMYETGIDVEMAAKSITDGFQDMGIDAVYCNEKQKQLVLVQSKWRTEGSGGCSQNEILTFVEGIKRIMSLDFAGANDKIKQKIPEISLAIKDMDYTLMTIFCHTGSQSMNEYISRPIRKLKEKTNEDASEILDFYELKMSEIFTYLASGEGNDVIEIDDVILNNWGFIDSPLKAYYGTISAAAIGDWYMRFGNKLFDKNIRYYKGNTDVNDGITRVLKEEVENFFYYNNGIKLLCKKITRKTAYSDSNKTGLFRLEGVSLVNGAQTTGSIGKFFSENREQTDKANVLIQIIEIGEDEDNISTQITKLSNTQNKIENKDFAALDPEQDRLKNELLFSNILYLYKTGATVDDPAKQISLDEAIVAQACMQDDVSYSVIAKGNVGALTEDITKAPYKILFNASTNAFRMNNSIQVMRIVERFLQNRETNYEGRNKLALVHGNRLILHLMLQQLKQLPDYGVTMIDRSVLERKVEEWCPSIIEKVIDKMNTIYPDAYPANIFKNVGRCREIVNAIFEEKENSN